ncbi:MAG TPA: ABC transporter permease [Thermoanaerobaculia bacterium]|nr:ABC transporter permease [Thermoanaerobaculia bacterium]
MASWRRSFRLHLRGGTVEQDVDDEIAFHIETRTRDLIEEGFPPHLAREEALRLFGEVDGVRRTCREIGVRRERGRRWTESFSELRQDAAFALRQLRNAPAFALIAVFTLALGIGATTAIFSLLDAVVLRPLPFPEPERIVNLWSVFRGEDRSSSAGNFHEYRKSARSFDSLAAVLSSSFNLTGDGAPERIDGARVTAGYFETFGVRPALGRAFSAAEDAPGRERVVVLSHGLWRERFGGEPRILGRAIRLNGLPHTVIGVMPASFTLRSDDARLWVPMALEPEQLTDYGNSFLRLIGRLRPGVSPEAANAEVQGIATRLKEVDPRSNAEKGARIEPYLDRLLGGYRRRLLILLGAVGCVLLIACVNVANLLLARGSARSREIAIRSALGAGRGRIVRQLLTESLVLSLAGAAAGIGLAYLGLRCLVAISPPGVPRLGQAGIDGPALACALGLGLAASLLSGVVPALRTARPDLQTMLKEGGRSFGAGSPRDRVRHGLLVAEVALTLVLLVGAGLLIRSALELQRVAIGFDPEGLLTAQLSLPEADYPEQERAVATVEKVLDEVRGGAGVESAAAVSILPLSGWNRSSSVEVEGHPRPPGQEVQADTREVTAGYFRTMGIPLLRGRDFTPRDRRGAPPVAVVNQMLARLAWPGEDAIGKRLAYFISDENGPAWIEVAGVVGDARLGRLETEMRPGFYIPLAQSDLLPDDVEMALVVRTEGDPAALAGEIRRAVLGIDSRLPVFDVATMDEIRASAVATTRFNMLLLTSLGVIGLLLAGVGIYGVIAWFVSQRTQEIGLRMALGATERRVLAMVAWQALRPVIVGMAVGIAGAAASARLLSSLLFGVSAADPATFAGVLTVLALAALLASWVPARRASRVDPSRALAP